MTRRVAAAIIAGVLILGLVLWLARPKETPSGMGDELSTASLDLLVEGADLATVALYFPDNEGMLSAEERRIATWASTEVGARRMLQALIAGPEDAALNAPLPAEVSLGPVYLSPISILYVDLVSKTLGAPPPTGSQMELMAVYSLVNTLMLGIPEIEAVVLLWNGRQPSSFAGHVDTSLPMTVDRDLIRTRR